MRPIDADVLKELLLKERDAIPKTVTAPHYEFSVQKPNHAGDLVRGGIKKALRCMENTPTLTLNDLGIVRCNDCAWFDDEGYENYDPEMPELRMGFCRIWRRDTQACRFCSMGGGE